MISTSTSSMPRANGGYRHVVLVVDVFSSYLSYVPIKSMSHSTRFFESVVTMYQNSGHPIKLLKMHNWFNYRGAGVPRFHAYLLLFNSTA